MHLKLVTEPSDAEITDREAEDTRFERWRDFVTELQAFASEEGWPAVLSAVARAMNSDPDGHLGGVR